MVAAGGGTLTLPRPRNRRQRDQTPWTGVGNERALGARPWRPGLLAATVHGYRSQRLIAGDRAAADGNPGAQSRARCGAGRVGEADRGDALERARRRGA